MGSASSLGQDWENHDLAFTTTVANVGRLYTAPEHYDQAICCGFRVRSTGLARGIMVVSLLAATGLSLVDPRWAVLFVLPAFGVYYPLAHRARMRDRLWQAVEVAAKTMSAQLFDTDDCGGTRRVTSFPRSRILVLGYLVRGPLGGLAWHHLQYVVGAAPARP